MTRKTKRYLQFYTAIFLAVAAMVAVTRYSQGQTISQPVPQLSGNPGQLQQPQVYWVPTRAWTPVRNLLNAPPLFYWAPYTPVGAPYDAQVQPVVPYRRAW